MTGTAPSRAAASPRTPTRASPPDISGAGALTTPAPARGCVRSFVGDVTIHCARDGGIFGEYRGVVTQTATSCNRFCWTEGLPKGKHCDNVKSFFDVCGAGFELAPANDTREGSERVGDFTPRTALNFYCDAARPRTRVVRSRSDL